MDISNREILRYLGYGKHTADERVLVLIEECLRELNSVVSPKNIDRVYPLRLLSDDEIDFTVFRTKSKDLSKNLMDCSQVILFAATLGTEVDMLLARYTKLQMSKAVVMQACSAAMIEAYCDEINSKLKQELEKKRLYLRPRFSPGYGDFSLRCQKELTSALETGKRVGIMLTESLLMTPSKSVTAVMGVSEKPYHCEIKGCEVCAKKDCAYKRG